MKTYEFTKDITCGLPNGTSKAFSAGDTVGETDLEAGNFQCCVRMGHLVEFTPKPVEFAEPPRKMANEVGLDAEAPRLNVHETKPHGKPHAHDHDKSKK